MYSLQRIQGYKIPDMPGVFEIEVAAYRDSKAKVKTVENPPEDVLDRTKFLEEWKTDAYLEEKEEEKLLDRTSFLSEFKTDEYLRDFYTKVEEPAMRMVLQFLPIIVTRIGPIKKIIDFGAGPTIHVAVCFRKSADEIYLADYLPQNRNALEKWMKKETDFDWTLPLQMIDTREGGDWTKIGEMEPIAREKIKGIFHCDCFMDPAVETSEELQGTFDTLVTIFCVEYCCNTYEEYKGAIKNMAKQIRKGGFFVMGGILEETWCSFGGRKFSCLYITQQMMLNALNEAGLYVDHNKKCILYEINGMFMVVANKQ